MAAISAGIQATVTSTVPDGVGVTYNPTFKGCAWEPVIPASPSPTTFPTNPPQRTTFPRTP